MNVKPSVIDVICDDELRMVERLKTCWTGRRTERKSKVADSASILLEMGKLYCDKSEKLSGMSQKISFLKSAVLISGARARFQSVQNDSGEMQCIEEFSIMSGKLLQACNARNKIQDILSISEKVKSKVKELRLIEKRDHFRFMGTLEGRMSAKEIEIKRRSKLAAIRVLTKLNSQHYKNIMKEISEICIDILGDVPCQFSLVGLGSLARDETTLFSDFEHIILLEDTARNCTETHEKVKEYFRWYSVVFQVIIIGIGETLIPSVGIKSINDLYSDVMCHKGFFDTITPDGISFDGRFPHSCKTPLGKQEPSKNHKFVIELIQTVSTMLEYLDGQESLDNGYHLDDILLRTCYIHGSENLHDLFEEGCRRFLQKDNQGVTDAVKVDEVVASQAKFIADNLNTFYTSRNFDAATVDMENIKDYFFRPASVLVGCLARIYGFSSGSNFEFFDWFREKILKCRISEPLDKYLFALEYSLAVACEARIKIYSGRGKQTRKVNIFEFFHTVGKDCAAFCIQTILVTADLFCVAYDENLCLDDFEARLHKVAKFMQSPASLRTKGLLLQVAGFCDEALETYSELWRIEGSDEFPVDPLSLATCYAAAAFKRPRIDNEPLLRRAEEHFCRCGEDAKKDPHYIDYRSKVLILLGKVQQGLDLIEGWMIVNNKTAYQTCNMITYIAIYVRWLHVSRKHLSREKFLSFLSSDISQPCDPVSAIVFGWQKGSVYLDCGRYDDGRRILKETILICYEKEDEMPLNFVLGYLKMTFIVLVLHEFKEDATFALDTLHTVQDTQEVLPAKFAKEIMELYDSLPPNADVRSLPPPNVVDKKIRVHLNIGRINYIFELARILSFTFKNFGQYSRFFDEAPENIMTSPVVLSKLRSALTEIAIEIRESSVSEIRLKELEIALVCFKQVLTHPCFVSPINQVVSAVFSKILQYFTESSTDNQTSFQFNEAIIQLSKLDINSTSLYLQKFFNKKRAYAHREASEFVLHTALKSTLPLLAEQRRHFVDRYCSFLEDPSWKSYDMGIQEYVSGNWHRCAFTFWRLILSCNSQSQIWKKSVEMFLFVVLRAWEFRGYEIKFSEDFAFITPTNTSKRTTMIGSSENLVWNRTNKQETLGNIFKGLNIHLPDNR